MDIETMMMTECGSYNIYSCDMKYNYYIRQQNDFFWDLIIFFRWLVHHNDF